MKVQFHVPLLEWDTGCNEIEVFSLNLAHQDSNVYIEN